MIGKRLKKKNHVEKLIDYNDFVRFREERQEIIKNPFEQNWKKAIAIEQILSLYKVHEPKFIISNAYDRKRFDQYNEHKYNQQFQDKFQFQNQDSLMKKYFNMHQGIEKFDQQYENIRIKKLQKVLNTRNQIVNEKIDQKTCEQKFLKYKKIENLIFKKDFKVKKMDRNRFFQQRIDQLNAKRNVFKKQKEQIQKLQKKAIYQLGLNFPKQNDKDDVTFNFEQFLRKEKLIFQKYIDNISIKDNNQRSNQELQPVKQKQNIQDTRIPRSFYQKNGSNHLSQIRFVKAGKNLRFSNKKYFRIEC